MNRKIKAAVGCALSLFIGIQNADAAGPSGLARGLTSNSSVRFLVMGKPALAPLAFVKFCSDNPADCEKHGTEQMVELTADKNKELLQVNATINRTMRPENDAPNSDVWEADKKSGDCEDFALTKRRKLLALGWPSGALRMAVAYTSSGNGHAVLVVRTSKGDLVLDNRNNSLKDWRRTDLSWVKIQSGDNPRYWNDL